MSRIAALVLVALAAAGCWADKSLGSAPASYCEQDGQRPPYARNPTTGMCLAFASVCDLPAEWASCTPTVACMIDDQCVPTEHCADLPFDSDPATPARACATNAACHVSEDCAADSYCDTSKPSSPAGDDGTCSRGTPGPPLTSAGCLASSECGPLQICPAQYGGCSSSMPTADGVACPSVCENACKIDTDCGDPATSGLRCNAAEVCGKSTPDSMGGAGVDCAGWCVKP